MGIDLAPRVTGISIYTSTGVHQACFTIKEVVARGSKKDPPIPEAERIARCLRVANRIVRLIKDYGVKHVGIEGYAYSQAAQAHQIGEVGGVVKTQIFLACGIIPRIVQPTSARKHVLGYGGSVPGKKKGIERVVVEGLGVDVANDHEADATVVARWTFDTVAAEEKEMF